jgi:hypothetical protein
MLGLVSFSAKSIIRCKVLYEIWEYERGYTYALCAAGSEEESRRAAQDGGHRVLTIEADTWEQAKRQQNDYVSAIRKELMNKGLLRTRPDTQP